MEINEEKLKEILKEQRKEFQEYIGTLSESFESQVKILAESVLGIQQQLVALREMVAVNTKNIEIIREIVASNREMVVSNAENIEIIREMVARNTENIEIMKADIQFIKQSFKHKVDLEEFEITKVGRREKLLYLLPKVVDFKCCFC